MVGRSRKYRNGLCPVIHCDYAYHCGVCHSGTNSYVAAPLITLPIRLKLTTVTESIPCQRHRVQRNTNLREYRLMNYSKKLLSPAYRRTTLLAAITTAILTGCASSPNARQLKSLEVKAFVPVSYTHLTLPTILLV